MAAGKNSITTQRLWLVLNDQTERAALAEHLSTLGHTVASYRETPTLTAILEWPQVLVLDDAFFVADEAGTAKFIVNLKAACQDCEILLLSSPERRYTAAALRAGASAYLLKPVDPAELHAVVTRLAAQRERWLAVQSEQEVFASLLASSAELHGKLDERETLQRILTGIQRLGFDRVRLLRLSEDGQELLGKAQVGMSEDFWQVRWSVTEDEYWQRLCADPRPRVCLYEIGQPTHSEAGLGKDGVSEWLCVPLLWQNQLIGQICADNKYSHRPIQPRDWQPLALFGLQAAAAIKEHELLAELQRERERHELIIEKLPLAAVSIDTRGDVVSFNQRAAEIFGYQASEVLGRKVHTLHEDAGEPARLALQLAERGGQLSGYECNIRTKSGQLIPINLSANRLYDERGQWDWSVGYFEDRRLSEKLNLLLRVSNILVSADTLPDGLQCLATEMTELFPQAFCRVLLFDEQRQSLKTCAAAAAPQTSWEPGLGQSLRLDEYPGLAELLARGWPRLLSLENPAHCNNLLKLTQRLKLPANVRSLLLVPLVRGTQVIGLLDLGELVTAPPSQLTLETRRLVEAVAAQTTLLIERWQLIETERQRVAQAELLYQLAQFVQEANDEAAVLHAMLTGVTASYGLRFNRALVLMLDEAGTRLSGRLGIGQTGKAEAQQIWESLPDATLADFQSYLAQLRANVLPETKLAAVARRLDFERADERAVWLFAALEGRAERVLNEAEYAVLPPALVAEFQPGAELVLLPLVAHQQVLGLLIADNKFNRVPILPQDVQLLRSFVNTAAVALAQLQLLNRFYTASDRFDSAQPPRQLQEQIVREIKAASGATSVVLIDADEQGQLLSRLAYPASYFDPDWRTPRQNGISKQVLLTGRKRVVPDVERIRPQLHPRTPLETKSMVCLPLRQPNKRLGVVWLHFDHLHPFTDSEIAVWQLLVNHLTNTYERVRRIEQLEGDQEFSDALAQANGTKQVAQTIIEHARHEFRAEAAIFWAYDEAAKQFQVERSCALGIERSLWLEQQQFGPRQDGTTYRFLRGGFQTFNDLQSAATRQSLGVNTARLLEQMRAGSLLVLALKHDEENLGILYLINEQPHSFGHELKEAVQSFGQQAARALHRARLQDQADYTTEACKAIACAARLGDHEATLCTIANEVKRATMCDAVVLFEYDEQRKALRIPPTLVNVWEPEKVSSPAEMPDYAAVYRAIEKGKLTVVNKMLNEPDLARTRFAREEGIVSCLIVPMVLKTEQQYGVLFINYRRLHRFTEKEKELAQLLADQAALALHVSRTQRSREYLKLIYEAGQDLTSSFATGTADMLARLLEKSIEAMTRIKKGARQPDSLVGTIQLYDANTQQLEFSSIYPPEAGAQFRERIGKTWSINRDAVGTAIGITGRAILEGRSQLVADVEKDPNYLSFHPDTRSELVVPLLKEGTPIGSINFESTLPNGFDDEDQEMAERLADFAVAMLIGEELRQRLETSMALSLMGLASSTWEHELRTGVRAIQLTAQKCLQGAAPLALSDELHTRLLRIEKASQQILDKRIPASPLGDREAARELLYPLLHERIKSLCKWKYPFIDYEFDETSERNAVVRVNPEWLKWAVDILVDNAARELEPLPERRLRLRLVRNNGSVEAEFSDTGPGIRPEVRQKLFKERITPAAGAGGQGMGLLYARLILRCYNGDLFLKQAAAPGTTMVLSLPVE